MKKNEELIKNKGYGYRTHKILNKTRNFTIQKLKKPEIEKILSEYESKYKTMQGKQSFKKKKYHSLKLNETYNPNGHNSFGDNISYRKKIEQELSSFSKENRQFFNKALKKYNFEMEVYIPQNFTKKEFSDKNFLINRLIHIEKMNKRIKRTIEPIEKETKHFSMQYKYIKSDNTMHQKNYLTKVEHLYQDHGYKLENIEYKNNENIFTPSFLLDRKFGENQQKDTSKFSSNNFDHKDKKILKRFEKIIFNKLGKNSLDEDNPISNTENLNFFLNEKDEEMKKEIIEENRIMNMTKREYFNYSKKLKEDINKAKKGLDDLFNTDVGFFNNTPNKSSLISSKTNYSKSIKTDINKNDKKKKINRVIKPKSIMKSKNDDLNIFLSARGLDLESDFNKRLPSIDIMVGPKDDSKIKTQNISEIKKKFNKMKSFEMRREKTPKQKKITKLYKFLMNKTEKEEFPYKEIESYFKKYTNRVLPTVNPYMGSNLHGIVGELQKKSKENDFIPIAKGNENIKFSMKSHYFSNLNNSLENKIENMDNKIGNLHYSFLEKLLANNKRELLNK